ncbi:MAG TPA: hypothetical protein VFS93_00045 [Terrimesophilobacter sp.]|nr:hypothetical protein [Terrimesophilobacter sp.]
MTILLLVVLVSLGVVFLWGLLAPRTQWRVLVSWSYRDPHANEPTGSAYTLYRLVAALGIATMVVSGFLAYRSWVDSQPPPPPPLTAVERMWGSPDPLVVNRVVHALDKVPAGLVDQPILGYQAVSGTTRQPVYLFRLGVFDPDAATEENGYIGTDPDTGFVALDTAELVVKVAGDPQCFPHAAVIREDAKAVRVGIYYGQANPADGSNAENLADCNTRASGLNVPVLVPLKLASPLGDRPVLTLAGDPIRQVPVIDQ